MSGVEVDNLLHPIDPLQVAVILPRYFGQLGFHLMEKREKMGAGRLARVQVCGGHWLPEDRDLVIASTASLCD